jgi:hypothetical protein
VSPRYQFWESGSAAGEMDQGNIVWVGSELFQVIGGILLLTNLS